MHVTGAAAAASAQGSGALRYADAQRTAHYGAAAAAQHPLSARTSWDLGPGAGSEALGAAAAERRELGSAETLARQVPGKQGPGRTIAAPGLLAHASVPVQVSSPEDEALMCVMTHSNCTLLLSHVRALQLCASLQCLHHSRCARGRGETQRVFGVSELRLVLAWCACTMCLDLLQSVPNPFL